MIQLRLFAVKLTEDDAMRRLRVRLTVRQMMAVVAGVALSLWTVSEIRGWREQQEYCRYQASIHDERAQYQLSIAAHAERGRPVFYMAQYGEVNEYFYECEDPPKVYDPVKTISPVDRRREAAYHLALKRRFKRAACYPWCSVPSVPPIRLAKRGF
jgi:hypothetical protein